MSIPFRLIGHFAKLAYETYQTQQRIADSFMGTPTVSGGKMFFGAYHDSVPSGFCGYDSDAGFALTAWLERESFKITDGRTSLVRTDGAVARLGKWSSNTYEFREDDALKHKADLFCVPGDPAAAGFTFLRMAWEKAQDPCFPFAHSTGYGKLALLDRNGDDFRPRMPLQGRPYSLQLIDRAAQRHMAA